MFSRARDAAGRRTATEHALGHGLSWPWKKTRRYLPICTSSLSLSSDRVDAVAVDVGAVEAARRRRR